MKNYLINPTDTVSSIQAGFRDSARRFHHKRDRALAHKPCTDDDREFIRRLDGKSDPPYVLHSANFGASSAIIKKLYRSYSRMRDADPFLDMVHVTIVNSEYATSDEKTVISLTAMQKQARYILSQISHHWVAVCELQAFQNVRSEGGGKLLCPHVHAIGWGRDFEHKAAMVAATTNERMSPSIQGARAVVVKPVQPSEVDLVRVTRYPFKPADTLANLYQNLDKGIININSSEKGDRYVRFLRIFQLRTLLEQDRMMFASGRGVAIRSAAIQAGYDLLRKRTVPAKRAAEMELIREFWADFMPRIGFGRFELPIIR